MRVERPAGDEFLKRFAGEVFMPIFKRLSVSVLTLPGMEIDWLIRYLTDSKEIREKFVPKDLVVLMVNSGKEEFILAEWKRMLVEQEVEVDCGTTIEILSKIRNKKVLLVANMIKTGPGEELLASYKAANSLIIEYCFGFLTEITQKQIADKYKLLGEKMVERMWYIPMYTYDDVEISLADRKEMGLVDKNIDPKKSYALSGGLPSLLKIVNQGDIIPAKGLFDNIWLALSAESKDWLRKAVIGNTEETPSGYLVGTGVVKKEGEKYILFSPLFEEYIKGIGIGSPDIFTQQEKEIFELLKKKLGEVVSRDEISDGLWGKMAEEKYSDWSINQVTKRLRDKLESCGSEYRLKTIREKGYVLERK